MAHFIKNITFLVRVKIDRKNVAQWLFGGDTCPRGREFDTQECVIYIFSHLFVSYLY